MIDIPPIILNFVYVMFGGILTLLDHYGIPFPYEQKSGLTDTDLTLVIDLAEITIKGQLLKLKGVISGKIDSGLNVDATGELTVEEDFVYQASDNVKLTLFKAGKATVGGLT